MKRFAKIFGTIAAAAVACACMVAPAFADYQYTITFYDGNLGGIVGGTVTGTYNYGDDVTVPTLADELTNSAYYAKGFAVAGTETVLQNGVPAATADADYVVVYGLKSNRVSYTLHYVDQDGNELGSDTYYGDKGDSATISYKYIQDYLPQTLKVNIGSLGDEGTNDFYLTYTHVPEGTTTVQTVENDVYVYNTTTGQRVATDTNGDNQITDEDLLPGETEEDVDETVVDDDDNPLVNPTEEETIDDDDNPLSGDTETSTTTDAESTAAANGGISAPIVVGIIAAVALIAGLAYYFGFAAKRKKDEESDEAKAE